MLKSFQKVAYLDKERADAKKSGFGAGLATGLGAAATVAGGMHLNSRLNKAKKIFKSVKR